MANLFPPLLGLIKKTGKVSGWLLLNVEAKWQYYNKNYMKTRYKVYSGTEMSFQRAIHLNRSLPAHSRWENCWHFHEYSFISCHSSIVDLISFIFFVLSHVRSFRYKSFQLIVDAAAGAARRCIISWIPFIVKCYSASIARYCTHFENVLSSIQQYRERTTWPFCIPLRIEVLNW